jgi:hypothetical protein
MRKSIWMIPVVLLFTALGSTTAHADSIVIDGSGNVIGINGILIAGTTYNVTWGTAIDPTFASSLVNASLINADIVNDLNAYGAPAVADAVSNNLCAVGVDGGVSTASAQALNACPNSPATWGGFVTSTSAWTGFVGNNPRTVAWDEFTVVATPEPGTTTLTLTGLGLLGLLVVLRKRIA